MPGDPVLLVLVGLGGGLGSILRFWLSGAVARRIGETFPWGTLAVNVSGAIAIGFLAGALLEHGHVPAGSPLWLGLATGILGGYTTVSSFSLQTLNLLRAGERRGAAGNVLASLSLCLSAVSAGFVLGSLTVRGAP